MKKEVENQVEVSERAKWYVWKDDTDVKVQMLDDIKLEVITSIRRGSPLLIIFKGRSKKAIEYTRFQSMERRTEYAVKFILKEEKRLADKKAKSEEKKAWQHNVKVGDFFYSSWGYDQTNVNFYQVLALIGKKSVVIREVNIKVTETKGTCDYVVPIPGDFRKENEFTKRISLGNRISFDYRSASLWDGTPKYKTGYGYGH